MVHDRVRTRDPWHALPSCCDHGYKFENLANWRCLSSLTTGGAGVAAVSIVDKEYCIGLSEVTFQAGFFYLSHGFDF